MEEKFVKDFSANKWTLRIGEYEYIVVGELPMPALPELPDKPLVFRVNVGIGNKEAFTAFTDGMNKDTKQFEFHTQVCGLYPGGHRGLKATYRGYLLWATASGAPNSSDDLTFDVAIMPEGLTKEITERFQSGKEQPPYEALWEFDLNTD